MNTVKTKKNHMTKCRWNRHKVPILKYPHFGRYTIYNLDRKFTLFYFTIKKNHFQCVFVFQLLGVIWFYSYVLQRLQPYRFRITCLFYNRTKVIVLWQTVVNSIIVLLGLLRNLSASYKGKLIFFSFIQVRRIFLERW